jgi:NAD(P)H-hydrate epimerase
MQPVVSLNEMRCADDVALALSGHEALVERAGEAVAELAMELLGDPESSRVVVLCGPGSNGADGRVAARILSEAGSIVETYGVDAGDINVDDADLVIDALYGTGLARAFAAPRIAEGVPVLSVDIASGIWGDSGEVLGQAIEADWTLAIQALKIGHLLGAGPEHAGEIVVADIGIVVSPSMVLLEEDDRFLIAAKARDEHKWSVALGIIAGSSGMEGAAVLCAQAAQRSGAGMVRLITTAESTAVSWPLEAVRVHVDADHLVGATQDLDRCHALVVGPGLGRSDATVHAIVDMVSQRSVPMVLDADGLFAFQDIEQLTRAIAASDTEVVITPHEGELARLLGSSLLADRVGQLRALAAQTGAVVLLKGQTTTVVAPEAIDGIDVVFCDEGSAALATAGTGDVLAGIIGALLARGMSGLYAGGLGALVHALGAQRSRSVLVASDLPYLVGEVMNEVLHGS